MKIINDLLAPFICSHLNFKSSTASELTITEELIKVETHLTDTVVTLTHTCTR